MLLAVRSPYIKPIVNFSAGALKDIGYGRPEHRNYPTNPLVRNLVVQSKTALP